MVSALVLAVSPVYSAIYEYRDDRGKRVFVDSLSKVPLVYRDQVEPRTEARMTPAEEAESDRLREISAVNRAIRQIDSLLAEQSSAIQAKNNQILVPVRVSRGNRSQRLNLLLDTGANRTVFHLEAMQRIGSVGSPVGEAQIANGDRIPLYAMNLDRFEIGPFDISPAQVQVIDYQGSAAHQGLLGMDILSQVKYDLDVGRQELRWAPEEFERLQVQKAELQGRLDVLKALPREMQEPVPSAPSTNDRVE